ncbi:MAG: hypothetical protein BroJett003_22130 [Planctomycetota bacterium]|nr:MAG: hypothetical protein BroJett003_22130 [Planctomycetota bacterium]
MNSTEGQPNGFELSGTIGQSDAQMPPVMTGGSFELIGGFWPVVNLCYCLGDLNGDRLKDRTGPTSRTSSAASSSAATARAPTSTASTGSRPPT